MANKVTLVQNWVQNFNLAFIGQARDGGGGAKTESLSYEIKG
jgi:hypothetical protein